MRKLIDVSHTIEHDMVTYKGLPAPIICDWLSREASRARYAPGTEFQIGRIEMVANTGTYVDSPFHRFADLVKSQVASMKEKGSPEVAFRIAIKDGKLSLTARALKGIQS